jgi:DNA-binding protein H-NS
MNRHKKMVLSLADITVENLLGISSKDLQDFQVKLSAAIKQRIEQDKIDFHNEMHELASKRGFSLNAFLANPPKKVKIAKYRNPTNSKQVWAGHGRKPNWLLDLLATGRSLEEFEV